MPLFYAILQYPPNRDLGFPSFEKTNIFDSKTIILPLKTLYYLAIKPVLFCAKNHSLH